MPRARRSLALVALLEACAADLRVVGLRPLGPMPLPAGVEGRDGGLSGLVDGRAVWVYGDTVTTTAGTYPNTWRNNTMSWTDDLDARDGVDPLVQPLDSAGAPPEFFPRTLGEEQFNAAHIDLGDGDCAAPCGARLAIWGGAPLPDPQRGRSLLLYAQIYAEPGPWNFRVVGTSIAVWDEGADGPRRPEVEGGLAEPTLLFDAEAEGEFGAAMQIHEGDVYLFACTGGVARDGMCRLARAPAEDCLRRGAWRFWDGARWTATLAEAAPLFEAGPNLTVHWSAHLDRWLMVQSSFGVLEARTAPALEGPWSRPTTLLRPEQNDVVHGFAHAPYQRGGGRFELLSYLSADFWLVEVELAPR